MAEYLVGGRVAFYRLEPCKLKRVTFYNGKANGDGVSFSNGRLPVTEAIFSLYSLLGASSQFDFDGFPFPDGFTCYPSDTAITNIIIEYEDMSS